MLGEEGGWGRRVTANFEGVDVMPLLGAIVRCHNQLWGSGRGAVAGCLCSMPLQGARGG